MSVEELEEQVRVLRALVVGLVRELNESNPEGCLGDKWVQKRNSTTFNQQLEALVLPLLETCGEE